MYYNMHVCMDSPRVLGYRSQSKDCRILQLAGTGLLETLNTHVNAGVNVTGLVVSVYVLAL